MNSLETESIEIIRETVATAKKPVMLYSIGKDSSVMLHLARKAFFPAPLPFSLLHVDTGWKFQAMYEHRAKIEKEHKLNIIVYKNLEGQLEGINPFTHGSSYHTEIMKTRALKMALDHFGFDMIMGGARRDEENSRAKERIFSIRTPGHRWDPKSQRPEFWNIYNTQLKPHESLRVFPLSNWTELDIWTYILQEKIEIVPLYFAKKRPVVRYKNQWIMIDDNRYPFQPDEKPEWKKVRFRTLGCWPLTAAIESDAESISDIVTEIQNTRYSERQGRLIDSDEPSSMEKKKAEGYF